MPERIQSICVMTFNVFYALRSKRLERSVIETFLRLKPDIIAFQEVWEGKKHNFARDLARKLGYHLSFAARGDILGRKIGLAMLSARSPAESFQVFLPPLHSSLRPRILQVAIFAAKGKTPWIIAQTHLESIGSSKTRETQLKAIMKELEFYDSSFPVLLMGDLNTKKKEVSRFSKMLTEAGFSTPASFPAYTWKFFNMKRRLDWIAVRNGKFTDAGVMEKTSGSDHKPVWARIQRIC